MSIFNDDAFTNIQSVFGNRTLGLNTPRDGKTNVDLQGSRRLYDSELLTLYRGSKLAQKLIDLLPDSSFTLKPTWQLSDASIDSSTILQFFNNLPTLDGLSFWESFERACKAARLYGDAYLIIGIEDGLSPDNPVDLSRITAISWIATRHLTAIDTQKPYTEYYQLASYAANGTMYKDDLKLGQTIIHASRVIHLVGSTYYDRLGCQPTQNDSILQAVYTDLANYEQTISACTSMIVEHTLFIYKMKDFHKLAIQSQNSNLFKRISLLGQGLSVLKTLVLDAEFEDASFINRVYTGVEDVLALILNHLAAVSGLPKTKLLGTTNSTQFSEAGMSDRYEWAACVAEYQSKFLLAPLTLLSSYYLASVGYIGEFQVDFPSIIQLTPLEELQLKNQMADLAIKYVNAGVISPMEVRASILAGTQYSTELILDDREYQKWRQEKKDVEETNSSTSAPRGSALSED